MSWKSAEKKLSFQNNALSEKGWNSKTERLGRTSQKNMNRGLRKRWRRGIFYRDALRSNYKSLTILNDSIGIRLKNAVHLGKKFLAAIFSAILYSISNGLKYASTFVMYEKGI